MAKGKKRTKPGVPGASGNAGKGDNSAKMTLGEQQTLFAQVRSHWIAAQSKIAIAKKLLSDVVAEAREAGFTKQMMEIADKLATTHGEAKITGEVSDRLHVARLMGHAMGAQYDLFEKAAKEGPATVDRSYDEGRQASASNQAAKPPYSPETPEYESYMQGFHDHQGEIAKGFKQPDHLVPVGEDAAL